MKIWKAVCKPSGRMLQTPWGTRAADGLDTNAEIKMHLLVCLRPCVPSQTGGLKEEGRSKDKRDKKQIQTIRLEIDGLEIGGRAKCDRQR